jgi:hypothetical protein
MSSSARRAAAATGDPWANRDADTGRVSDDRPEAVDNAIDEVRLTPSIGGVQSAHIFRMRIGLRDQPGAAPAMSLSRPCVTGGSQPHSTTSATRYLGDWQFVVVPSHWARVQENPSLGKAVHTPIPAPNSVAISLPGGSTRHWRLVCVKGLQCTRYKPMKLYSRSWCGKVR